MNKERFSSFQNIAGVCISEREEGSRSSYLNLNLLQFRVTSNHGITCYMIIFLLLFGVRGDRDGHFLFLGWGRAGMSRDYWSFSLMGF